MLDQNIINISFSNLTEKDTWVIGWADWNITWSPRRLTVRGHLNMKKMAVLAAGLCFGKFRRNCPNIASKNVNITSRTNSGAVATVGEWSGVEMWWEFHKNWRQHIYNNNNDNSTDISHCVQLLLECVIPDPCDQKSGSLLLILYFSNMVNLISPKFLAVFQISLHFLSKGEDIISKKLPSRGRLYAPKCVTLGVSAWSHRSSISISILWYLTFHDVWHHHASCILLRYDGNVSKYQYV